MKVLSTLSTLILCMPTDSWALNLKAQLSQQDDALSDALSSIATAIEDIADTNKELTTAVSDIADTNKELAATNKDLTTAVSDIPYDTAYYHATGVCHDN